MLQEVKLSTSSRGTSPPPVAAPCLQACHLPGDSGSDNNWLVAASDLSECNAISAAMGCGDCKSSLPSEILPYATSYGASYATLCPFTGMGSSDSACNHECSVYPPADTNFNQFCKKKDHPCTVRGQPVDSTATNPYGRCCDGMCCETVLYGACQNMTGKNADGIGDYGIGPYGTCKII